MSSTLLPLVHHPAYSPRRLWFGSEVAFMVSVSFSGRPTLGRCAALLAMSSQHNAKDPKQYITPNKEKLTYVGLLAGVVSGLWDIGNTGFVCWLRYLCSSAAWMIQLRSRLQAVAALTNFLGSRGGCWWHHRGMPCAITYVAGRMAGTAASVSTPPRDTQMSRCLGQQTI